MANEIRVETSFGTLVACIGGDEEFPEILVFLQNNYGNELMVCAITDQSIAGVEDVLRVAVYGDTRADDYTQRIVLKREDILAPNAMWQ